MFMFTGLLHSTHSILRTINTRSFVPHITGKSREACLQLLLQVLFPPFGCVFCFCLFILHVFLILLIHHLLNYMHAF